MMKKRTIKIWLAVAVACLTIMSGVLPVSYYFLRNKVLAHWGWCSPDDEIQIWTFRWLPVQRSRLAMYLANPGGIIHYPNGYSETFTGSLSVKGSVAMLADGTATLNLNGSNQILLTIGGAAADSFTMGSNFPWSDHGNGTNSGFQITGYTGTAAPIVIGNGANPNTRTENISIYAVDIDISNAGAGAVGIDLINVQNFWIDKVNVVLGSTNQGCVLLDGSGNYTGAGEVHQLNCGGSSNGQFGVRGQNSVTATTISQGNFQLTGATNTVCFDANQTDFSLASPNCNAASTALSTEGASTFITGTFRRDSGVTKVATWGTGTGNSHVFCEGCGFPPLGGNTITNNSVYLNSIRTNTGDQLSNEAWAFSGTAGTGRFDIVDEINRVKPFTIFPGGNIFLGNTSEKVKIIGPESTSGGMQLDGARSGSVTLAVPSAAGSNTATLPANTGTVAELNMPQTFTAAQTQGTNGVAVSTHQHKRISTGRIAANTRTEILLNWTNNFSDASYTVTCNVEDSSTSRSMQGLTLERLRTKSASQVGVVINNPTDGSITGTLDCTADHD